MTTNPHSGDLRDDISILTHAFNHLPVSLLIIDSSVSKLVYANDSALELFGYTQAEFFQLSLNEIDHLFSNVSFIQIYKRVVENSRQNTFSSTLIKKDGEAVDLEVNLKAFHAGKKEYILLSVLENSINGNISDIIERKKTEEQLRKSELRLKEAQAVAKVGSWETDLQTFEVTWSDETYRIFEIDQTNFSPTHEAFLQLVHPSDRIRVANAFLESNEVNQTYQIEHCIITPNGVEKNIQECWFIFADDKGLPLRAIGTCQDITERVRNNEIILRSQANLKAIIENTDAQIYSLDRDLKYITFNSAHERVLKEVYDLKIFPGDHVYDFLNRLNPVEVYQWNDVYTKALKGEIVKFEKEFFINGIYGYSHISIHPMWENNKIIGLSCFVNDISKEKKAEEAQRQSDARYKQIVETAHEGIWMIDADNRTTFVNNRMCEMLGYTPEEMIGRTTLSFKDEEGQQLALKNLERRRQGIKETYEASYLSKDGIKVSAYVSSTPMFDKDGNYSGTLAMVTDITDKIALQQTLLAEQISNQHEVMKAVIGAQERERAGIGAELHDNVNQLLATSRMYINMCLTRDIDPKESLLKSEQYITEAIDELRKLSHALVGPTQDKVMGLIPSIEDLIEDVSSAKNIKINFHHRTFKEERNEVGLKLVIYRIIQEQLNNILKHAEASEIEIELSKQGKDLEVNINDDGRGFDTSSPKKGIGLKNITNRAKLYDGSVQVLSFPGNGCKMKITFKNHGIGCVD